VVTSRPLGYSAANDTTALAVSGKSPSAATCSSLLEARQDSTVYISTLRTGKLVLGVDGWFCAGYDTQGTNAVDEIAAVHIVAVDMKQATVTLTYSFWHR
jgi:hypothetical protein